MKGLGYRAAFLVASACLVSAVACSTATLKRHGLEAVSWEQEVRRRGLDPATLTDPLAIGDELREAALAVVGSGSELEKLRRLHGFLFDEDGLRFEYRSIGTYSAADTYRLRRGNCASFTILFIAMARSVGLPLRAALPRVIPTVEKVGDLIVVSDHIVAIYERTGGADVFDFAPSNEKRLVGLRPIDDLWLGAIYLNNLGAEALLEGNLPSASTHLRHAVALAPDFAPAHGNLGAVLRRLGDLDGAFRAYRQSLGIDPQSETVLHNLASLYLSLGRLSEARTAIAAADRAGCAPYMLLLRGDFEMRDGKPRRALRLYRRAARGSPQLVDTHLAVGRAELARGRAGTARKSILRALDLEPDNAEAVAALARLDGAARE
ncbi:MAG: tetratricopeptide repeat protein [bacterium]|nr:tetratricopeptide repeat protein [bacterium]